MARYNGLFTEIKARIIIPHGLYCYKLLSIDDSKGIIYTKKCPYLKVWEGGGYYCSYLVVFDDPLLNDECKICDINL